MTRTQLLEAWRDYYDAEIAAGRMTEYNKSLNMRSQEGWEVGFLRNYTLTRLPVQLTMPQEKR